MKAVEPRLIMLQTYINGTMDITAQFYTDYFGN